MPFSDIHISQGSVATCLKRGGIFKHNLLQIYYRVGYWKNFENRIIIGEVMTKSLVSCFFDSRCSSRCAFHICSTASLCENELNMRSFLKANSLKLLGLLDPIHEPNPRTQPIMDNRTFKKKKLLHTKYTANHTFIHAWITSLLCLLLLVVQYAHKNSLTELSPVFKKL